MKPDVSTEILKKLLAEYDNLLAAKNTKAMSKWNPPILKILTGFLSSDTPLTIRIWHIRNGIFHTPRCRICDNETKFDKEDKCYRIYCGKKCAAMDPEVKKKKSATFLDRYGTENYLLSEDYQQKAEVTNQNRYGEKYAAKSDIVQERIKNTNLSKYGVHSTLQVDEVKEKISKSMLERYGVINPMHNPTLRQKTLDNSRKYQEGNHRQILEKRWENNLEKYGRRDPNQLHMTAENSELSYNVEWLTAQHTIYPITYIAKQLGITTATLANRFKQLNIAVNHHLLSTPHQMIIDHIKTVYNGPISINDRKILSGQELDIYLPEKKLAIEINGIYFHSEISGGKNSDYHLAKTIMCKNKNIQLCHIWDIEVMKTTDIVFSRINNLLGLSKKIGARQLQIQEITGKEAAEFHNHHHLSGSTPATLHIALTSKTGDAYMVMSIGKTRYSKRGNYEIIRMTTRKGVTIVGGISKLLKHLKKTYPGNTLVTFADRRWGDGTGYQMAGFVHMHNTGPGYWYIKGGKIYHRSNFIKKNLSQKLNNYDPDKSEWDNMTAHGWDRVWDCGHSLWKIDL